MLSPAVSTRLRSRTASAAALAALLVVAATLGTRAFGAGYWIDEGITVGIAGHPIGDIPGLLRQDGAPPLYYLLLSAWMSVFGSAEAATHALSLVIALATVPAALWAGRALFGARAGWAAAAVAATVPPLTAFAQETRMYSLLALLSVLASATFVLAFVHGSRRALVAFTGLAVLLAYTHNWGLYLLFGLALSLPVAARVRGARTVAREAALAGAVAAAAYAPWLPTLVHQAEHTGAPWSTIPDLSDLFKPVAIPLGEGLASTVVLVVVAFGIARRGRRAGGTARASAATLAIGLCAAGLAAWGVAQVEPGWADRYMVAFVGPVILLVAAGLAAAGRAGLVALAAVVILWTLQAPPAQKSNAREVARAMPVEAGDLVVTTHPEQIAVVRHYAPDGLRWATALGAVEEPTLFDWRDAPRRLRAAGPEATLGRLLRSGPRRLVLVGPLGMRRGGPEWLDLVARRSSEWRAAADRHPRLRRAALVGTGGAPTRGTDIQAVVYELRAP